MAPSRSLRLALLLSRSLLTLFVYVDVRLCIVYRIYFVCIRSRPVAMSVKSNANALIRMQPHKHTLHIFQPRPYIIIYPKRCHLIHISTVKIEIVYIFKMKWWSVNRPNFLFVYAWNCMRVRACIRFSGADRPICTQFGIKPNHCAVHLCLRECSEGIEWSEQNGTNEC